MQAKSATRKKFGRRGDPRMHAAVAARVADPSISLFQALKQGGFVYSRDQDHLLDSEYVTLSQRKNQLGRRLRLLGRRGGQRQPNIPSNADGLSQDSSTFSRDSSGEFAADNPTDSDQSASLIQHAMPPVTKLIAHASSQGSSVSLPLRHLHLTSTSSIKHHDDQERRKVDETKAGVSGLIQNAISRNSERKRARVEAPQHHDDSFFGTCRSREEAGGVDDTAEARLRAEELLLERNHDIEGGIMAANSAQVGRYMPQCPPIEPIPLAPKWDASNKSTGAASPGAQSPQHQTDRSTSAASCRSGGPGMSSSVRRVPSIEHAYELMLAAGDGQQDGVSNLVERAMSIHIQTADEEQRMATTDSVGQGRFFQPHNQGNKQEEEGDPAMDGLIRRRTQQVLASKKHPLDPASATESERMTPAHPHEESQQRGDLEMALHLHEVEARVTNERCMLMAGYSREDAREPSLAYLNFASNAWIREGDRLTALFDSYNRHNKRTGSPRSSTKPREEASSDDSTAIGPVLPTQKMEPPSVSR